MLKDWHDFYILLGTAAAALVALLFVAASIGADLISAQRSTATRTYMTPIIYHYTCVLFVSLLALVPDLTDAWRALIIALVALVGASFPSSSSSGRAQRRVRHRRPRRLRRKPARRLRGDAGRRGICRGALDCRPQCARRRAGSSVARQHPQRLGLDHHLRTQRTDGPPQQP